MSNMSCDLATSPDDHPRNSIVSFLETPVLSFHASLRTYRLKGACNIDFTRNEPRQKTVFSRFSRFALLFRLFFPSCCKETICVASGIPQDPRIFRSSYALIGRDWAQYAVQTGCSLVMYWSVIS